MTDDTKSFLKHTIMGLLGGGAMSALYAMHSAQKEKPGDPEFKQDEIVVPLSRRNFLKAVRPERLNGTRPAKKKEDKAIPEISDQDVATMSPKDMAALKRELLRKKGECKGHCGKISKVESPSSGEATVRNVAGAGSTFLRDSKGRFLPDSGTHKSAGVLDDARGTVVDNLGLLGGITSGLVLTKVISDRIQINKKKRAVEESRKRYADALSREANDEDLPYYSKTASDRSFVGSTLGTIGLAGIAATGIAGLVMYRIMENRRIAEEKAKDKDLAKYPTDKSVRFRFPQVPGKSGLNL